VDLSLAVPGFRHLCAVHDGRVLRNTILRTSPAKTTGVDVEAATTDNVTVQGNWIAMDGKYGVYVRFASDVTIAGNVIWMPPGAGTDFADGIELDENAFNVQITGNDVYGTGLGHAAGVFALPYPQASSGMIAGNRFFGAPLTPGPLQVGDNLIQPLTGQPVTLFALGAPSAAGPAVTTAQQVPVTIEGGVDAVAWLLSETDTRMPAADDPGWQSTMPTTFTLSDGAGVKRVILWRKLADGTVSDRPEVAVIELMPAPAASPAATGAG
jgi:Periplasmic copper-binding protein (NosD)